MKDRGNFLSTHESNKRLLELIYRYEINRDCKDIVSRKKILALVNKISWKTKPQIEFRLTYCNSYLFLNINGRFITRDSIYFLLNTYTI